MSHKIAKLLLERAGTFAERSQAVQAALQLGMPLKEIEEYLDWLDMMRPKSPSDRDRQQEGNNETDGR